MNRTAIFLITTADRKGLVARITGFFAGMNLNILTCRQYTDILEKVYYMRVAVELPPELTRAAIEAEFKKLADELELHFSIHYSGETQNVAVMVSKTTHCLYDLLTNSEENLLGPGKVKLVIGNHPELEEAAEKFRIPFYCFPVERSGDPEQERQIIGLLEKQKIDLVVLARYMRILSNDFINRFPARIINIHHAFLPAFMGGNPYQRAWERGVKMIGATAHYATADLDEGPIIEQDVERITHESLPEDLRDRGRDIERRVLTRAVRAHLEHRVIISGHRTIVFSK
ncbi:MAG: formyltetrahydrofolate deformylase [Lentisphaerae bacterium]|nr:formyltetrahydrofolate deformylase [Lentisphaerota bacterium]